MNFKQAVIDWMMSSVKSQEREDDLITALYNVNIKEEQFKKEIQSFFKLHKHHINRLSAKSIRVIIRLIKNLETDADNRSDSQLEIDETADRDIEWNRVIGATLLQKLREADNVLGVAPVIHQNPSEVAMGQIAIDAYLKTEKLDIEKSQYDTSKRDNLKKELGR